MNSNVTPCLGDPEACKHQLQHLARQHPRHAIGLIAAAHQIADARRLRDMADVAQALDVEASGVGHEPLAAELLRVAASLRWLARQDWGTATRAATGRTATPRH